MKPAYRNILRPIFEAQFKRIKPDFVPLVIRVPSKEKANATMMPNEFAFAWKCRAGFWLLLSVLPHQTQERFSIDAGWSDRARFPYDIQRPSLLTSNAQLHLKLGEAMYGFAEFLLAKTGSGVFLGWDVWRCSVPPEHPEYRARFIAEDMQPVSAEVAQERVHQAVARALSETCTMVFPALEELGTIRGVLG